MSIDKSRIVANVATPVLSPNEDADALLHLFQEQLYRSGYKLPGYALEVVFAQDYGQYFRFDLAWKRKMLALEFDGHVHRLVCRWRSDMRKSQWASALGWRVVHVSHQQLVDSPDSFFELLWMAYNL